MGPNMLDAENYLEWHRVGTTVHQSDIDLGPVPTKTSARVYKRQKGGLAMSKTDKTLRQHRSRSRSSDEAKRRQRGRPRLATNDQTASERRRTQIRNAQRAYRQRKETTIAELNDKVAELEQTILKMNRTSVAFNNSAANSALPSVEPDLAHDLQTVALRFSARALSTNSNQTLESVEEVRTFSPRANQRGRDTDIAMKSDIQIAEATNHQLHAPQVTNSLTSSPWGYSFDAGPVNIQCGHVEEVTRDVSMNDFPCQPVSMNPPPAVRRDQRLVHFPVTVNEAQSLTLVSNKALAPPLTYCFKETTFARRLLRASYERACRVMSNPVTNAATIQNMCRFVFCFNNSANITKWVNKMACATTEDSLEMWVATQLHVGNAGLHYARTSLDGANEPPSFWANKAPMGPRRSTIAETPVPDSMTVEEIIEMVGFQGEWFDSNDVEHYLKSKGLVLDEQSSRVELDLDALPSLGPAVTSALGSPASSNPSTDPSSPKDADSMFPEVSVLRGGDQLWGAAVANLLDYTNDGVDTQVHEMPSEAKSLAASTPFFNDDYFYSREIKKSVIDVDKFVSTIVEKAVCLGRTPGWRKTWIDSALALSMQEVF